MCKKRTGGRKYSRYIRLIYQLFHIGFFYAIMNAETAFTVGGRDDLGIVIEIDTCLNEKMIV